MHIKPRLLLASIGLAFLPVAASAQDIELVTEAPVTFEVTFGTSVTTSNGQTGLARKDITRAYNSTVTTNDILNVIRSEGHIPGPDVIGWRLVAVRPAPADLYEVHTEFNLYAIKVESGVVTSRVPVPDTLFSIAANYSVESTVTTHSTRNIITSRGTVTNHAELILKPTFVRTQVPPVITGPFEEPAPTGGVRNYNLSTKTETVFTIGSLLSSGFSRISYTTSSEPVFFFALGGVSYTSKGDFNGVLVNRVTATKRYITRNVPDEVLPSEVDPDSTPASGLVSVRVTVGAAKLVERSLYPEVSF